MRRAFPHGPARGLRTAPALVFREEGHGRKAGRERDARQRRDDAGHPFRPLPRDSDSEDAEKDDLPPGRTAGRADDTDDNDAGHPFRPLLRNGSRDDAPGSERGSDRETGEGDDNDRGDQPAKDAEVPQERSVRRVTDHKDGNRDDKADDGNDDRDSRNDNDAPAGRDDTERDARQGRYAAGHPVRPLPRDRDDGEDAEKDAPPPGRTAGRAVRPLPAQGRRSGIGRRLLLLRHTEGMRPGRQGAREEVSGRL